MTTITIATSTEQSSIADAIARIATGQYEADMPVILEGGSMELGAYACAMLKRESLLMDLITQHSKVIGQLAAMKIPTAEQEMLIDWLSNARHELHELLMQIEKV